MHDITLILTITGGLAAALGFGFLTHRLGLSPIVGYLLAGLLVGPHTPGFVASATLAPQLAEIGVVLLMFGVGLEFHLDELLAVRRVAVPGAVAQSLAATALGAGAARLFGWDWAGSIVFGLALSVASTVVLVRVLSDSRDLHTRAGHIAVGWLVVEDVFTVVVLVLLPALFAPGAHHSVAAALGLTALKLVALLAIVAVTGTRLIPWLLDQAARSRSRELFTLTVLVLALGLAVGATVVFGVSMALGAFLAGMVVGRSEFSLRAAADALPMRDAFAVLFFVSVGMLLDPAQVLATPWLMLAALAIVLVGKPLVALVLVVAMRYPLGVALRVAVALAQIGEFSFIVATVATGLGVLAPEASQTIVAVAIVSIVANPLLYRAVRPIERWAAGHPALGRLVHPRPRDLERDDQARQAEEAGTVVVGYGPIGRTAARLLRDNGVPVTVIDLNVEAVRAARESGIAAAYGDASRPETLVGAGIERARNLVLSSGDMVNPTEIIRIARELNPRIQVLARTSYLRDVAPLRAAGATVVFSGEAEVALAFTEAILERLGATPDQIGRERDRVHRELGDA